MHAAPDARRTTVNRDPTPWPDHNASDNVPAMTAMEWVGSIIFIIFCLLVTVLV